MATSTRTRLPAPPAPAPASRAGEASLPALSRDAGGPPPPVARNGSPGRPPAEPERSAVVWRIGVWVALAAVTMTFVGFTSAYLVRRQAADWTGTGPLPWLLWVNTAVLLLSSVALERGRRDGLQPGLRRGLLQALALGALFVVGQVSAWRQLVAMGVGLASNPHSSFFYVLTGVHAAHVLIAMSWLVYAAVRVSRKAGPLGELDGMVGAAATFWHFMGGLWLFLLALLFAL